MLDEPETRHTVFGLARRLEIARSTIQRQIDRMVQFGWLSRREEKSDQYRVIYTMTKAGEQQAWDALADLGAVREVKVFFGPPIAPGRGLGAISAST